MNTTSVQSNSSINIETLEALLDQGQSEDKRNVKNRMRSHQREAMNKIGERIHALEDAQSNMWRGALMGFFVNLFSQGLQGLNALMPGLGSMVSGIVSQAQKFNPFEKAAADQKLEAEKLQAAATEENKRADRAGDYLKRLEE
ncbi:MAG: hypothetical protein R3351_08135, partial [Nitrospirales bacterium]|nr:hypothetical protein [Nitrospirales bacterium]